jgi:hypothetical protein
MRHSILLFAFVLAACGGDDPPAQRVAPPPVEEASDEKLTARDVDRELDEIEREINDGKSDDQRLLSQR